MNALNDFHLFLVTNAIKIIIKVTFLRTVSIWHFVQVGRKHSWRKFFAVLTYLRIYMIIVTIVAKFPAMCGSRAHTLNSEAHADSCFHATDSATRAFIAPAAPEWKRGGSKDIYGKNRFRHTPLTAGEQDLVQDLRMTNALHECV